MKQSPGAITRRGFSMIARMRAIRHSPLGQTGAYSIKHAFTWENDKLFTQSPREVAFPPLVHPRKTRTESVSKRPFENPRNCPYDSGGFKSHPPCRKQPVYFVESSEIGAPPPPRPRQPILCMHRESRVRLKALAQTQLCMRKVPERSSPVNHIHSTPCTPLRAHLACPEAMVGFIGLSRRCF